jgi:acetylornithine/succinyldiaminopimelate/putrescine aminotransferase
MSIFLKLSEIRDSGGVRVTDGLSDDVIRKFAAKDPKLPNAVDHAYQIFIDLKQEFPDMLARDEIDQIVAMHAEIINFYTDDVVNPYVTLAARGPWVITSKGAVVYDTGGYGMLGFGHAPKQILHAMSRRHVMANIMTANFSQLRLSNALRKEIGHTRGACPYDGFLCLNSGSEAISLAARISDINAKLATEADGPHAGKKIKHIALEGGFHGRTDRPALYSDSTRQTYQKHLASFQNEDTLLTVEPNNLEHLQQVFEQAVAEGCFIESMFIEPVMGEGNPGAAITREFYDLARKLTAEHGALLLVDSIQAGLRAHGCLSIVDYPGFEGIETPDMEAYSKALNAGQYPLSVLAVTERGTGLYQKGVYGNTMTSNPRALDVACKVLEQITPEVRENIRTKGRECVKRMQQLSSELKGLITGVQGTGLLFSCEIHPDFKSFGRNSIEEYMRMKGVGVIHGGKNSLRFTPHFNVTSDEIDLIIEATRQALLEGPRKANLKVA